MQMFVNMQKPNHPVDHWGTGGILERFAWKQHNPPYANDKRWITEAVKIVILTLTTSEDTDKDLYTLSLSVYSPS